MVDVSVTGEVSNSKVAAVFDSAQAARSAAADMALALELQPSQVQVIAPGEGRLGAKLEPESRGIWHTILRAHLWLGIAGALAGLVAFAVMMWIGIPFVTRSPLAAGLVMVFFGAVGGLMLGGLVALRPDHDRYIFASREAAADHRTTVVVHAFSSEQRSAAAEFLSGRGADVTSTL